MIVVSQGGCGGPVVELDVVLEPITLFFSGSDFVVRLTSRLLFLWLMLMTSGSVDVADVPDAADDDDDDAMLLQGAVVYPDSVW